MRRLIFVWPCLLAAVVPAAEPVAPNWLVITNDQTISYEQQALLRKPIK